MIREAAYHTITRCRSCGSEELMPLFSLGEQQVSDFVSRDRVHSGPRVPIDLVLCAGCTLVQQKHTAPQGFLYTRHYWYRSGVTQTMRDALRDVAEAAQRAVQLWADDVVLDIGSNDGTLLRSYTTEGIVRVGVEPASNLAEEGRRGVDVFLGDFWDAEKYIQAVGKKAKAITACGMFYDLENPSAFIADVARVLAPDGVFVAQLMCLKQTLDRGDVGNFCHEHLEFYSLLSLDRLFGAHGLGIFDVEENGVNGGSYRLYVRHASRARPGCAEGFDRVSQCILQESELADPATYADFFARLEANKARCRDFLAREFAKGKRIHVYGASTKGNVVLQHYGLYSFWNAFVDAEEPDDALAVIDYAADRSPEKWGKYTIGTGIPIISEEESRQMKPDYYLVLPYAFREEFLQREAAFRERGGKFLFALPKFEVV